MNRRMVFLAVVLVAAVASRIPAQRFTSLGIRDVQVLSYFQKLQQGVRAGDRPGVAALVNYPLRVNRSAKDHFAIASAAELVKRYDAVFTPAIRQAILAQQPAKLSAAKQGIPVAAGAVWLMGVCSRTRPPVCHVGVGAVNFNVTAVVR